MTTLNLTRTAPIALLACLPLAAPGGADAFPTAWGPTISVGGVGDAGDGAGIAIGAIGGGGRPDMVLMAYDDPRGGIQFRYRVGYDLDADSVAAR